MTGPVGMPPVGNGDADFAARPAPYSPNPPPGMRFGDRARIDNETGEYFSMC